MRLSPALRRKLVAEAKKARRAARARYSGYEVGAAVLGESGRVYGGCNVESPSLIWTSCAEVVAILKALSEGERRIRAVCTVSEDAVPCGRCRQLILETGGLKTPILAVLTGGGRERVVATDVSRLLPKAHTFGMSEEE